MERLTKRTPAGVGVLASCGNTQNCPRCCGVCVPQDIANTRLAEYEDTGMEPEEINQLREFTESATNTTLRHIYELVQAERDGRLVVMAPAYTVEPPKLNMDPAQLPNLITGKMLKALERMGAKAHGGE